MEHFNEITQQQLQEILTDLYNKGQEPNMEVIDLINEIKIQLMSIMFKTN